MAGAGGARKGVVNRYNGGRLSVLAIVCIAIFGLVAVAGFVMGIVALTGIAGLQDDIPIPLPVAGAVGLDGDGPIVAVTREDGSNTRLQVRGKSGMGPKSGGGAAGFRSDGSIARVEGDATTTSVTVNELEFIDESTDTDGAPTASIP